MAMDALLPDGHAVCESVSRRTRAALRSGNQLRFLPHAVSFFPELFHAIERAERSVEVELYRVYPSRLATDFAEQLLATARRGVRVTVVLDGLGSRAIPTAELNRGRGGGINVAVYNPINLASITRVGKRNHRKLVVVDGAIAFIGGMSIDDNFAHHASCPCRETLFGAEHPADPSRDTA